MERVLICLPSMFLLEQVWEQVDHGVQSLSTQSLEQGTSQATGSGGGEDEHRLLSTSPPGGGGRSRIVEDEMLRRV